MKSLDLKAFVWFVVRRHGLNKLCIRHWVTFGEKTFHAPPRPRLRKDARLSVFQNVDRDHEGSIGIVLHLGLPGARKAIDVDDVPTVEDLEGKRLKIAPQDKMLGLGLFSVNVSGQARLPISWEVAKIGSGSASWKHQDTDSIPGP